MHWAISVLCRVGCHFWIQMRSSKMYILFSFAFESGKRVVNKEGFMFIGYTNVWRWRGGFSVISIGLKNLCLKHFFSYDTGLHWKTKGRNPRCGDCGIWLGIHSAYGYHSQHDAWGTSREVWEAEHRGPDHVNQWDQFGWFATLNMSEHYKGMEHFLKLHIFKWLSNGKAESMELLSKFLQNVHAALSLSWSLSYSRNYATLNFLMHIKTALPFTFIEKDYVQNFPPQQNTLFKRKILTYTLLFFFVTNEDTGA